MTSQPPTSPADDLRARWRPSAQQLAAATAVLATVPADQRHSHRALVAVALPGKSHGVWISGQHVQHMPGVWLAHRNQRSGPLGYVAQRDTAASTARAWLADQHQAGTVSTITVDAGGDWVLSIAEDDDQPRTIHRGRF